MERHLTDVRCFFVGRIEIEYLARDPIMKRIANEEKTEGRMKFDKG